MPADNLYKYRSIPKGLSFDEESLLWRLRSGEGIPKRPWHKPLDKTKSWEEIKEDLDKKLECRRADAIFKQLYPPKNPLFYLIKKLIKTIKISFLFTD